MDGGKKGGQAVVSGYKGVGDLRTFRSFCAFRGWLRVLLCAMWYNKKAGESSPAFKPVSKQERFRLCAVWVI